MGLARAADARGDRRLAGSRASTDTIAHARAASPFYRAPRDWPDIEISRLDDMRRLPFTTPADLAAQRSAAAGAVAERRRARRHARRPRAPAARRSGSISPPDDLRSDRRLLPSRHGPVHAARRPRGDRLSRPATPAASPTGLAAALRRLGARPQIAPLPLDPAALAAWLRRPSPTSSPGRRSHCSPRPASRLATAARRSASRAAAVELRPCRGEPCALAWPPPEARKSSGTGA